MNTKLSILIAGYFGFENAGDEAILAVTIKELLNRIPIIHRLLLYPEVQRKQKRVIM